ncbi:hypothetical protein [Pseudomonas bananamidigenes]|uniref:hypothetical protein n=1 Tax=Pseudomonas bananamidigenes TaxID=2843610 RepID=UPI0011461E59|nr:hypothetical protein [Pseudomonas bananamidigenes]
MDTILLRHKSDRRFLLLCDEKYNPISEERSGQGVPRNKAFYVRFPGGFMGVYSSPEGPVFFVNDHKMLFSDPAWRVSVHKKMDVNEVFFAGLTKGDLAFEYSVVELDPLDPWSEEEFDDFYIWLTKKRNNREFIDIWTDVV